MTAVRASQPTHASEHISPVNRTIADLGDPSAGPTIIIVASLHGNELSGIAAAEQVKQELQDSAPLKGRLLALVGNTRAASQNVRFIGRDLNRSWTPSGIRSAQRAIQHQTGDAEDHEVTELKQAIDNAINDAHNNPVVLLDLHTTSAESIPFVAVEDRVNSRKLAVELGVTTVFGIESLLSGLLISHVLPRAHATIVFEAGQHDSPQSPERHAAAIRIALEHYQLTPPGSASASRALLKAASIEHGYMLEARDRHAITPAHKFIMNPGYQNFARVKQREPIAKDKHGIITAKRTGRLFMPLYQTQGEDGFFLVKKVSPSFWYTSAFARALKLRRHVQILPGVRKVQGADAFLVDTTLARFLRRQVFALLGYRRTQTINQIVVFSKNDIDHDVAVAVAESRGK